MDLSDMKNVVLTQVHFYTEADEYPLFLPDKAKPLNYYARVTYRAENAEGTWEIEFPKVKIPFLRNQLPSIRYDAGARPLANFSFERLPLEANANGHSIVAKIVEYKVCDMTIEEIEKRLGCKIRIVGEDSK